jgi:hypothetical protein
MQRLRQVHQVHQARQCCARLAYVLLALLCLVAPAHPAAAAPPAQYQPPAALARFSAINIYARPQSEAFIVGTIAYGEGCPVTGRDTYSGWWLVQCSPAVFGWVSHESVTIVGDLAAIPPFTVNGFPSAQLAAATPLPPAYKAWRATYFANKDLLGTPVLTQDVPEINFDWGFGSPAPVVPGDYFSARYERTLTLPPGNYLLTLRTDDGARLFVDDQLVLDDWRVGALRELTAVRALQSSVRLRIEYFEEHGPAAVFFAYTPHAGSTLSAAAANSGTSADTKSDTDLPGAADRWRSEFFNNTNLGGSPAATGEELRGVYPLDRNWESAAPAAGIKPEFWSARFTGHFYFSPGAYEFFAVSDDGVRVYVDNILVLNAWFDGYNARSGRTEGIGAGWHTIRVEYYERTGAGNVRVWWALPARAQPPAAVVPPPSSP